MAFTTPIVPRGEEPPGSRIYPLQLKRRWSTSNEAPAPDKDEPEPHERLEKVELAARIREIIATLPQNQRIAILHATPEWERFLAPALLAPALLLLGWVVFRLLGPDLVDEL